MPFRCEATEIFFQNISEVQTLIDLSVSDEVNRHLFLKLASVSMVTKFQVFVETILEEFRYNINNSLSKDLSTHMKMNSLRLSMIAQNSLTGLTNHKNFTEDKKSKVVEFLQSLSYISNDNQKIDNSFKFNTKFPLGTTGKKELIELLHQIDGETDPFEAFGENEFDNLDSILQTRHAIIHQDRFNGTDTTVTANLKFVKELVVYIDNYLSCKVNSINNCDN